MDTQLLKQIDPILDELLVLPEAEQEAHLREICADRPDLYQAIADLLEMKSRAADLLGRTEEVRAQLKEAVNQDDVDLTGRRLGAYRVVREIGRGGMGRVFLAERDDGQFTRNVAIKVLVKTFQKERTLFLREMRILGQLNHPHIAQMYDSGFTEDGLPFFIMELIEGVPIHTYVAQKTLSLTERIQLFITVCEAVQFAHSEMVIHRDIKPSNILVTHDGRVKLLDFGISQLLTDPLEDPLNWVMTPEFASPEQLKGGKVNAQSDVYALGNLLHLLITGEHVSLLKQGELDVTSLLHRKAPSELLQQSRWLSTYKNPDRRHRLKGELDSVIFKALSLHPEDRYSSVNELAHDLRRFLTYQPIRAHSSSVLYNLRCFLKRNRWQAGAVLLLFASTVFFSVFMFILRSQAVTQRDIARKERDTANITTQFLVDIFEIADAELYPTQSISAIELLEQGEQKVRKEPTVDVVLAAKLLHALGKAYQNLGYYEKAKSLLEEAESKFHEEDRLGLAVQVQLDLAQNALNRFDHQEADSRTSQLLQLGSEFDRSSQHAELAKIHDLRGDYLLDQSQFEAARQCYEKANSIRQTYLESTHVDHVVYFMKMGDLYFRQGQYQDSRASFLTAYDEMRTQFGDTNPKTAFIISRLMEVSREEGDLKAMAGYAKQALDLAESIYEPGHPFRIKAKRQYASSLKENREYEAANKILSEALNSLKLRLGEEHPSVADTLNSMAEVSYHLGDIDAAQTQFEEALRISELVHGPVHQRPLTIRSNLSIIYYHKAQFDRALEQLEHVIQLEKELLGEDHPEQINHYNTLAGIHMRLGDFQAAHDAFSQAIQLSQTYFSNNHPLFLTIMHGFAQTLDQLGRHDKAIETLREVLARAREKLGESHAMMGVYQTTLGQMFFSQKRYEDAKRELLLALELSQDKYESTHYRIARINALLGASYAQEGKWEDAEPLLVSSLPHIKANPKLSSIVESWLEKRPK